MTARRSIRRTRRGLYRGARVLGDVNAVLSGNPRTIAKRAANKVLGRILGRGFLR